MKKAGFAVFLLIFLLAFSGRLEAAGLKVSPASFIIHDVNPGKPYDLYKETGLRLTIHNDDDVSHTYLLSTHRPKGKWEKGYLEIPDAGWCWFENSEITVEANGKGYGNIYLKISDEEKYYNQHWVVTLKVAGKAGPGGIALAIEVRAQIETKSKADVKEKPDGIIATGPSTLRFENVSPGVTQEGKVTVYNNDNKTHTYKLTSLFHKKGTKPNTYLTHSYQVMPDSKWITLSKDRLTIMPNSSSNLFLKLKIPDKPEYHGKKWEETFLVEPEEGLPGFIRVQISDKE